MTPYLLSLLKDPNTGGELKLINEFYDHNGIIVSGDLESSAGNIYPYIPSEWFYIYPDTVEIRANWDMELEVLNIQTF